MQPVEHSAGWKRFLRQFEATGREKADGYDRDHFTALSDRELFRARRMLVERGIAGDIVDIHGLRFVGDAAVVAALEQALESCERPDASFEIACRETLFELTNDATHAEALLTLMDGGKPASAAQAAEALARLVLPARLAGTLARFMIDGRHEHVRLPVLRAWLNAREGNIERAQVALDHLEFVRAVLARSPHRRASMLATWPEAPLDRGSLKSIHGSVRLLCLAGFCALSIVLVQRYLHTMPVGSGESRKSPDGRFSASIKEWSERDFITGAPRRWFHYRVEGPKVSLELTGTPIDGPFFGSRSSHRIIHWSEDSSSVDFRFPCTVVRVEMPAASGPSAAGSAPLPSIRMVSPPPHAISSSPSNTESSCS